MTRKTARRIAALILFVIGLVLFRYAKNDLQFLATGIAVGYAGHAFWHP
jgi:hypothetical protein